MWQLKLGTSDVEIYSFNLDDTQRVFLIDTPGFNDTNRSDADILLAISFFLVRLYQARVKLGGIVLLHDIRSELRMTGSARTQLEVVKALCGESAYRSIVCATSMWGKIKAQDQDAAQQRLRRMIERPDCWQPIIAAGGVTMKWLGDSASALSIVRHLVNQTARIGSTTLRLHYEVVHEKKDIYRTTAGRLVGAGLSKQTYQNESGIQSTETNIQMARLNKDQDLVEDLIQDRENYRERLKKSEEAQAKLRQELAQLVAEKEAQYAQMQEDFQRLAAVQTSAPGQESLGGNAGRIKPKKKRRFLDALPLIGILTSLTTVAVGLATGDGGMILNGISGMGGGSGGQEPQ